MRPIAMPSMVAHVLLVERSEGLLLADTGFGTADLKHPSRLGLPFRAMTRPALTSSETAIAQVQERGFAAEDVTDIVLSHLDLDHVGGIGDFPRARVHVYDTELEVARSPGLRDRARYGDAQWAHGSSAPGWR